MTIHSTSDGAIADRKLKSPVRPGTRSSPAHDHLFSDDDDSWFGSSVESRAPHAQEPFNLRTRVRADRCFDSRPRDEKLKTVGTNKHHPRRFSKLGITWLLGTLLLVGFCSFMGLKDVRETQRPIEQVQLGDRVAGQNPLREQVTNEPVPTPETHRTVAFEMTKPSGRQVQFKLLLSLEEIATLGAEPGSTTYMELPEMGVMGDARVVSITACPDIKEGNGNIVTGLFQHEPDDDLVNVWIQNAEKPIGCTPEHLFWSEDRRDFVPANELCPGDNVQTRKFGVVPVTAITRRPKEDRVYNLQVYGQHVYCVSSAGVLVHNMCAEDLATTRAVTNAGKELRDLALKGWRKGKGAPHYTKHGLGMGYANVREYTEAAKQFQKMAGQVTESKVGNLIFKYDHVTERILIVSAKERTIVSFYKANKGILSFKEAMKDHWKTLLNQGL